MAKKVIRVGIKQKGDNVKPAVEAAEDVVPNSKSIANSDEMAIPTCIRCYTENENDIQNLNSLIMRFNECQKNISINRVGYKVLTNPKFKEIDIAALHAENYVVKEREYIAINNVLSKALKEYGIRFKFIDFSESHKNSADAMGALDENSAIGEWLTIERGSVSDELFDFIRSKISMPNNIIAIRLPITDIGITYETEWIKGDNSDNTNAGSNSDSDDISKVSIIAYTESASDNIDTVMNQFNDSICTVIDDYTERADDKYLRIIHMNVIMNEGGNRLIDSLGWIDNIIVSVE